MSHRTAHAPVVYYARRGSLIKIGTTVKLRPRLLDLKIEELLAIEPGSYDLEKRRHEQFADSRIVIKRQGKPNEWFVPSRALTEFTQALRATHGLPDLSRWESRQLTLDEHAALALLPPLVMKVRPWTLERFASGLTIGTGDECWCRRPDPTRQGYGRIYFEGKLTGAHVASYRMFAGPIPEGFDIDHLCHDPAECNLGDDCPHRSCVNPAHLDPKSPRDNGLRGGGAAAVHARQTHCIRGHEFTPENTYRTKDGGRDCKACWKVRDLEKYGPRGKCGDAQRARTRCKNGHAYTPDNIYYTTRKTDGVVIRQCKTCRRERYRRWAHKREVARQNQDLILVA